ncbi:DUF7455 domain-containing protein [Actinospica acidithermotolerans]|uniref:DUF7455 domain-containing protein n=1 Tax=Actinospica acidithermotolerans TaxID=2828514 RepID=UPI003FD81C4F
MNETCDRCGPAVRAAYRVQEQGELTLCRHCALDVWPTLSAQGWSILSIDATTLAPQAGEQDDAPRDVGANE